MRRFLHRMRPKKHEEHDQNRKRRQPRLCHGALGIGSRCRQFRGHPPFPANLQRRQFLHGARLLGGDCGGHRRRHVADPLLLQEKPVVPIPGRRFLWDSHARRLQRPGDHRNPGALFTLHTKRHHPMVMAAQGLIAVGVFVCCLPRRGGERNIRARAWRRRRNQSLRFGRHLCSCLHWLDRVGAVVGIGARRLDPQFRARGSSGGAFWGSVFPPHAAPQHGQFGYRVLAVPVPDIYPRPARPNHAGIGDRLRRCVHCRASFENFLLRAGAGRIVHQHVRGVRIGAQQRGAHSGHCRIGYRWLDHGR